MSLTTAIRITKRCLCLDHCRAIECLPLTISGSSTLVDSGYQTIHSEPVGLDGTRMPGSRNRLEKRSLLPSLWSSCNQSVRSREPTLLCDHVLYSTVYGQTKSSGR